MTEGEFVELHGQQAWNDHVKPLKAPGRSITERCNANILVHTEIMMALDAMVTKGLLAQTPKGLLAAGKMYRSSHPRPVQSWKSIMDEYGLIPA